MPTYRNWGEAQRALGLPDSQVRKARLIKQSWRQALPTMQDEEAPIGAPSDWELVFTLPWPVSVNKLYAPVGNRQVKTQAGRLWEARAREEMFVQLLGKDQPWLPTSEPVDVTFCYYRDGYKGYDIDNLRKITQDALQSFIIVNDDQVYSAHEYKRLCDPHAEACVEVTIRPWQGEMGKSLGHFSR